MLRKSLSERYESMEDVLLDLDLISKALQTQSVADFLGRAHHQQPHKNSSLDGNIARPGHIAMSWRLERLAPRLRGIPQFRLRIGAECCLRRMRKRPRGPWRLVRDCVELAVVQVKPAGFFMV